MELYHLLQGFLAQLGVISLTLTLCSVARDRLSGHLDVGRRASAGAVLGLTAAVLMHMPSALAEGFRFDMRLVPVAIAGLISGPVGATVAMVVASASRMWLAGDGQLIGVTGIVLASGVGVTGYYFAKRGHDRFIDVLTFSMFLTGVALATLLFLPTSVQSLIASHNAQIALLLMNFIGATISTLLVRMDHMRRQNSQANKLYKQIVSALPDALNVKDLEGRYLLANEATARLMGAPSSDHMVGKTDFDFFSPEEAARFWAAERDFVQNPTLVVLEQRFERDNATVFISSVKAPYVDDEGMLKGIVTNATDVTAEKQLSAKLAETQRFLETAMTEMADGIALFNRDGRLIIWNRRYLEFFPYVELQLSSRMTLHEILLAGLSEGTLICPDHVPRDLWVAQEIARSKTGSQSELKLKDGRWLSKTTRTLDDGGWVTLYSDVSDKKRAVLQLERLANSDGLTELANRRIFDRHLTTVMQMCLESSTPVSLLMIDVDNFKAYNDTYGHQAGDEVLRRVAAVLRGACRNELDLVARYGGEEFAVVLPGTTRDQAHEIGGRLLATVRELEIEHLGSPKGILTVSVGHATAPAHRYTSGSDLIQRSDVALYSAKAAGRDQVQADEVLNKAEKRDLATVGLSERK